MSAGFRCRLVLAAIALASLLVACTHNVANIRTFASSVQVMADDTPDIVLADQTSCTQNSLLQNEFKVLEDVNLAPLPCAQLDAVAKSILIETRALQAYATVLNSVAQDQFVTTDDDSNSLGASIDTLKGTSGGAVAAAVSKIFSLVESAALSGYRQRRLTEVMSGGNAQAFKTIMVSYTQLVDQYSGALQRRSDDIDLMRAAMSNVHSGHNFARTEPLAFAEFSLRLDGIQADLKSKQAALEGFKAAVLKIEPAFEAAAQDLTRPNPKEIYSDVKAFAGQVKDAHDKLKKAFG
jgi:hypothetical protein